jgi:hypothetical protein
MSKNLVSEVMQRLVPPRHLEDPIEYVRDANGRVTHFKGLNGKLWPHPCVPYHGDIELFKALSVCCFNSHPPLNEREQEAFDTIYPLVLKFSEQLDEAQHSRLDSMLDDGGNQDSEWWHRKQIGSDTEAYAYAYSIAEKLVAEGWVKVEP